MRLTRRKTSLRSCGSGTPSKWTAIRYRRYWSPCGSTPKVRGRTLALIQQEKMSSSAGLDFPPLLEASRVGIVPRGAGDEPRINSDADSWFRLTSAAGRHPNAPETVVDVASSDEVQRRPGNEWLLAYMTAFWRLARQRIATVAPFRDGPPEDAPYRPHHEARVVQLRAFSVFDPNKGEPGTQYHHRWIVRMHKVNQWYPRRECTASSGEAPTSRDLSTPHCFPAKRSKR